MKQILLITKKTLGLFIAGLAMTAGVSQAQVTSYSFTSAGATGSVGPTQAQLNTAYGSTNLNGQATTTNGIQVYTIQASGIYRLDLAGASAGTPLSYPQISGLGSTIRGEFTFNYGDVLRIVVGQKGTDGCGSAGGGGGSFVELNGTTLLMAAGGGGAATSDNNGANSTTLTAGTNDAPNGNISGGTNGGGGSVCSGGSSVNEGGAGGGYSGDGATAPIGLIGFFNGGGGLAFTNGATGGSGDHPGGFGGGGGSTDCTVGGGGGGGYSGGAGGQQVGDCNSSINRSGGGGGGSLNTGINQVNVEGINSGDGMVVLTSLCDVNLTASGSSSTTPHICSGQTLTLSTNAISNYNWSTGTTTQSIVVSPTVTTTYSVSGTSALSCSNSAMITVTVSNAAPILTLTANSPSVCQGNSITLTGNGALTYTWSTGAISTATTTSIIESPSATTIYTLTGANGCGTASATIPITVTPLPVTAVTNSALVCASSPATLTSTGATTYTWSPGAATNNTFVVTPSANTIYTVTGQSGNCFTSATVAVNTNPLPNITLTTSTANICLGDQVTLSVSGNANSYTWTPGNQTGASITDSPAMTTVYSVEGTNSFGCTNSASQLVVVTAQPNLNITSSFSIICSGEASILSVNGASTYAWFDGSTGHSVVINPTVTTSYSVTGTNAAGCTATTDISVAVFVPTIGITSDAPAICAGSHANLTSSGADSYTWSTNSNAPSISVSPTVNTTYTVMGSVTDLNSGLSCDASNTIAISINPNPTITATASRSMICLGESVLVTADGAGATGTYTWTGGAGVVTTATNMVNPIADQNFTVTGADANGCKGKGVVLVQVAPCTGIATIKDTDNSLSIYPNPSNGEFTITSDQSITLHITNELGQEVKTISLKDSNHEVKVSNLSNGIYFITGKNENGSVMQKIIISK